MVIKKCATLYPKYTNNTKIINVIIQFFLQKSMKYNIQLKYSNNWHKFLKFNGIRCFHIARFNIDRHKIKIPQWNLHMTAFQNFS